MPESLLNKVLERGTVETYPSREALAKALKNPAKLVFYLGIDPNASFLHLGHTIAVRKLEQLRQLGCGVILLIGNFTATIGDPTDKSAARKSLTLKETEVHAKNYLKLLGPVLNFKDRKNPVVVRRNNEWWGKMSAAQLLALGQKVTTQRLLERDMFQERIKSGAPIYYHELAYPLLQAYDSVAMKVDGEIGGNDQTFNMLMGRQLVKEMLAKEKYVITTRLLVDPTGRKMGKSEGNAVPLDANASDMYGAIMSWPDGMIPDAFELLTDVEMSEFKKWQKELGPRDLKARLAQTIVGIYHGEKNAAAAFNEFDRVFRSKEIPENIPTVKIKPVSISAADLLVLTELVTSKGEARRVIEQGGMKLNSKVVANPSDNLFVVKGDVVQRGKRRFVRIA